MLGQVKSYWKTSQVKVGVQLRRFEVNVAVIVPMGP